MKKLLAIACCISVCFNALGWNEIGHRTSGGIAYHYLKDKHHNTLKKVLADLYKHPFVKGAWATELAGLTAEQKDIRLFMLASQWPDEVRKNTLYTSKKVHDQWHYTNYPLTFNSGIPTKPPKIVNIETVLASLVDSCKKQKGGNPLQLSWVFHLMQDLHQPLHTVALFNTANPNGDKGGNETYIQFPNTKNPVKLHGFWDALVTGTQEKAEEKSLLYYQNLGRSIVSNTLFNSSKLGEITAESKYLATHIAYQKGAIQGTETQPTQVSESYRTQCRPVAEQRVTQAGIRLGQILVEIYGR